MCVSIRKSITKSPNNLSPSKYPKPLDNLPTRCINIRAMGKYISKATHIPIISSMSNRSVKISSANPYNAYMIDNFLKIENIQMDIYQKQIKVRMQWCLLIFLFFYYLLYTGFILYFIFGYGSGQLSFSNPLVISSLLGAGLLPIVPLTVIAKGLFK